MAIVPHQVKNCW